MVNMTDKVADAELEILKVLWANENSMTDKQIRKALGEDRGWQRTTIQTLIKRLLDKGILEREKRDVFYYNPTISQNDFAKARTVDLLDRIFGGSAKGLVSTMLNNDILSDADMSELEKYWQERKRKK